MERSCRSESKPYAGRGNGKYRKQQGGKHFDASKCEGWEKEEEEGEASPCRHRRQLVPARPLSLPSRSFPPAISRPILQRLQRVRCALRALMMPISLSILLPYHLSASSRFTGIFLYPKQRWTQAKRPDLICVRYEGPIDFFYQSF